MKKTLIFGTFVLAHLTIFPSATAYYLEDEWESRQSMYRQVWAGNRIEIDLVEETGLTGYFELKSGPSWLTSENYGRVLSGVPSPYHEGNNRYEIHCRKLSGEVESVRLNVEVLCSS